MVNGGLVKILKQNIQLTISGNTALLFSSSLCEFPGSEVDVYIEFDFRCLLSHLWIYFDFPYLVV